MVQVDFFLSCSKFVFSQQLLFKIVQVGFLYLTNQGRLEEMMCQLGFGMGRKAILPVVSDTTG